MKTLCINVFEIAILGITLVVKVLNRFVYFLIALLYLFDLLRYSRNKYMNITLVANYRSIDSSFSSRFKLWEFSYWFMLLT